MTMESEIGDNLTRPVLLFPGQGSQSPGMGRDLSSADETVGLDEPVPDQHVISVAIGHVIRVPVGGDVPIAAAGVPFGQLREAGGQETTGNSDHTEDGGRLHSEAIMLLRTAPIQASNLVR